MRAATKLASALALTALAALALTACGRGGSSTSPSAAQRTTTATTVPSTTTTAAKPAAKSPHTAHSATSSHEGSAPFRVASGDNSIPDFGAEASSSERDRATSALSAYLKARAAGRWSSACIYLSSSARAGIERFAGASKPKKSCGQILAALSGSAPASARADTLIGGLASLRVKAPSAFALYYGPHSQKYVMSMRSEGGAWRVTQLAPIAYPLGSPTPPTG